MLTSMGVTSAPQPGAILHDVVAECASRPETLRAVAHCTLWSLSLHDLGHVFVVCPKLRHDVRPCSLCGVIDSHDRSLVCSSCSGDGSSPMFCRAMPINVWAL